MATRLMLADLAAAFGQRSGTDVRVESVGGVDAARRVAASEPFDVVVLAGEAIERLLASGHVLVGSRVDLAQSPVAIAVRAGAPHPVVDSQASVRAAVRAAPSIGLSTGPSGTHLTRLFERWGPVDQVRAKIVQAPPGVPVGRLVADGTVALGFQQLSELQGLAGIDLLGTLPADIGFDTVFSGALCAGTKQAGAAHAMLDFMASAEAAQVKRRFGMEPA